MDAEVVPGDERRRAAVLRVRSGYAVKGIRGRFDAEVLCPADIGQRAETARDRDRADLIIEIEKEPADIP